MLTPFAASVLLFPLSPASKITSSPHLYLYDAALHIFSTDCIDCHLNVRIVPYSEIVKTIWYFFTVLEQLKL